MIGEFMQKNLILSKSLFSLTDEIMDVVAFDF